VEGKTATQQSARDRSWPLSRELYFFTNGAPKDDAKKFVDFMLDPAKGQSYVRQTGFVPLN
ncbi:MAG: phosphate ABC transporter substrate-binding protein, partial [Duodenibacillus sp.]